MAAYQAPLTPTSVCFLLYADQELTGRLGSARAWLEGSPGSVLPESFRIREGILRACRVRRLLQVALAIALPRVPTLSCAVAVLVWKSKWMKNMSVVSERGASGVKVFLHPYEESARRELGVRSSIALPARSDYAVKEDTVNSCPVELKGG